jgi:hypothetical protein
MAMSSQESSPRIDIPGNRSADSGLPAMKRSRPLSSGQEALFFGVTFAIAVVLQLAVILKAADIIAW